ncbi:MAG TPA: N-glycosylase/DNA lyase [Candidatus Nanoarchaeia archaeon]|nr:N-glycosylase/DNA lyase [Candidatus Nanoarchaeia archaeon]
MDIYLLHSSYKERKDIIKQRLSEFSKVKGGDIFYELCFCLLTPQSNALKCDECIQLLKNKKFHKNSFDTKPFLRPRTRFYKNKSHYLDLSKAQYKEIERNLDELKDPKELREWLVKNVKGLGYKEASHFLRNIGYSGLAILDRHILKNLLALGVIDNIPSLTKKNYLALEEKFNNFSRQIKIPMDELDLLFWSIQTGKVFK